MEEVAMFEKILVPVDLTENELTAHASSAAEALANKFDSDLRFVNVQSLVPIAVIDYVPENFDEEIRIGLEKEIVAIAAKCERPPERVSTVILFGPVYQSILEEAENWKADVIIVGSHRPAMSRFLIGSNAGAIVRHATCSVFVVR
jgi:universal stress protein F